MKIFGLEITRVKKALNNVGNDRGWFPLIRESFSGAWQNNSELRVEDALGYWPVFRCVSLISGDVAKCRPDIIEDKGNDVWEKVKRSPLQPVLRKPNRFQTRIQFFENWMQSKLTRGNTYVLKQRDNRGVVVAMYVLAPDLVTPLVSDDGSVFYQLEKDNITGLKAEITVPASEIIHDRWNCLYHPLVGMSPITYAAAKVAATGIRIETASTKFFENGARPSGILTAPAAISDDTAKRLKEQWDQNYSGDNAGKVAVLGDGLKFEAMSSTAEDAQLIEQLKWTAEAICGAFGVPVYMVMGTPPTYNNVEALTQQYYSQCLQIHFESAESLLDEGLGLTKPNGKTQKTQFDLDALLRMDTATLVKSEGEAVKAGIKAPNEARKRLGLGPVKGGESPYLQQQNYSLSALADRDSDKPFAKPDPTPPAPNDPPPQEPDVDDEGTAAVLAAITKAASERFAYAKAA